MVTDDAVPEGHVGLHGMLYGAGAGGAVAVHGGTEAAALVAVQEAASKRWPGCLDGSELLALPQWLEAVAAAAVPGEAPQAAVGLFAVYASDEPSAAPRIVGYSRRVQDDLVQVSSGTGGLEPAEVGFVRVQLLGSEPRMWTRARLAELRDTWLRDTLLLADRGGASTEAVEVWPREAAARGAGLETVVSHAEREAFEERKWKMQLAMGTNLADGVQGEAESAAERRLKFLKAVEGDDWSEVINEQTSHTTAEDADVSPPTVQISSPFGGGRGGQASSAASAVSKELTVQNVEAILLPLRPMLQADGGDVEVLGVNVERGAVMLGLVGACTTCPAAGTTMEDGLEKALLDHFGKEVVREVVRVDHGAALTSESAVRDSVEAHLGSLRTALHRDGADAVLRPVSASSGERQPIEVEVSGMDMHAQLVKSSLTYRFPELVGRLQVRSVSLPVSSA